MSQVVGQSGVATERFTSFDGTGIAYRRWKPDRSAPRRPPVVLHHGFAVDADINWAAPGVVDALTADGFDVIGIDARGHGASDKPHDADRYGEDNMARDVAALADHLGLDHFDLVGYSMGAIVSVVAATQEPRIRRLVVGGVGAGVVEVGGVDTRAVAKEAIAAALLADDPDAIADPVVRAFRTLADQTGADREALAAQASVARQGQLPLERHPGPGHGDRGRPGRAGRPARGAGQRHRRPARHRPRRPLDRRRRERVQPCHLGVPGRRGRLNPAGPT